ncbi:hypothetical protein BO94DRAFT_504664 [Aspergillus sclerotioniger CBS 115572]|uniref:Uncharacterized protein n=1 Tax=Aspergillus sclerotioniger CBS 115572 TaxID=1450535 RepID=A0A317UXF4_9EURO|nr:hypothetical protein BO94DRAFT_504664 [Aspergillus sclerotioniger CBS 115572]PWY65668.1 hypothetical protein BO94DRAFT_504664 [Aspergillus sclerotioniger CBS 115572]
MYPIQSRPTNLTCEIHGIFCTVEIPLDTLDHILTAAYEKRPYLRRSLILMTTLAPDQLQNLTFDDVTSPPITEHFVSPFLGWNTQAIKTFLAEGVPKNSLLDYRISLIADAQTLEDDSLLFVVGYNPEEWEVVRVAGEYANVEATRLNHGARSIDFLIDLVDEDGVYKGVLGQPAVEELEDDAILLDGDY